LLLIVDKSAIYLILGISTMSWRDFGIE